MAATATALLERDEELATIERLLGAAAEGNGGTIVIEGEAGAGKTSLLGAAAEMAARREALVLRARGGEYERDFPYGVVRQLFEPVLQDRARREELLSGSAAFAGPVFEPGAEVAEGGSVEHGLYWLTADLAATAPLVLVVDDAQWADVASLQALAYIARRLDGLPVALIAAVRSGEPGAREDLLDELRREAVAGPVEPQPLSPRAAAALVAGETGRSTTERFAEACREATAGNPFLLAELARALGGGELDLGDEGAECLTRAAAAGVAGSVRSRLERLGDSAADVAKGVAVLEPNAERRLIAAISGRSQEEVTEASERLIEARILVDARSPSFVHPLVRDAVLGEMPEPRRAALHAEAARLLRDAGAEPDTVAAHLLLAEPGDDGWVVEELRAAASAALARGAPDAAIRYLRRALREPPEKGTRAVIGLELGFALLRADDAEGIDVLRAVRSSIEDPAARVEVAAVLSNSLCLRMHQAESVELFEQAMREVSDRRSALGLHLRRYMLINTTVGLEEVPDGLLTSPEEGLDGSTTDQRGVLAWTAFLLALGLGPLQPVEELAGRALGDPDASEADALEGMPGHVALVALALLDHEVDPSQYEPGIAGSTRRGALPGIAAGYGMRAFQHLINGELRDAQADGETALRQLPPQRAQAAFASWVTATVRALTARGQVGEAERMLELGRRREKTSSGVPGAAFLLARGELRRATGRYAEARHDFLAAAKRVRWLPLANPEVFGWRTGLALAEAALGNREEAVRVAEEAVGTARAAGGARGLGVALRARGTVAEGGERIEILRQAAGLLSGTRACLQHAEALLELGAALRRANFRRDARGPLREALELAHRCGAVPLEERARTELAATGARPRRAVLSGVDALTPSELRVARMAAEGMTNREIAQALTVTAKTVETHMRHVFQKLDVARRTELAGALG